MFPGSLGAALRALAGRLPQLAALVVAVLTVTSPSSISDPVLSSAHHIVALGDSVPSGYACDCTPFPELYGRTVSRATGTGTTVDNLAHEGWTTGDVRAQLETPEAQTAIRGATTVLLMIGANDFEAAFDLARKGTTSADVTLRPVAASVQASVTSSVRRIQALHPGVRVAVLGYWNVVKDGAAARAEYGTGGVAVARTATSYANGALQAAARATNAAYVSTTEPFVGKDGTQDPTGLLADDGDHPNAQGHELIAQAVWDAETVD